MATQSATVAGGCFWGVEELLRKVPGILDTEVGYAGGSGDPTYENVKMGRSGYAEAVRIDFDPGKISYERVLQLFFQLHDPTTLNRQGNDVGTQYRSTIFTYSPDEKAAAQRVIEQENASGRHARPVTTTIEESKPFYSAEEYHQDYLQKNPGGYTCHYWRGVGPA
jgi:methionine-S-sulfoxide reductase